METSPAKSGPRSSREPSPLDSDTAVSLLTTLWQSHHSCWLREPLGLAHYVLRPNSTQQPFSHLGHASGTCSLSCPCFPGAVEKLPTRLRNSDSLASTKSLPKSLIPSRERCLQSVPPQPAHQHKYVNLLYPRLSTSLVPVPSVHSPLPWLDLTGSQLRYCL